MRDFCVITVAYSTYPFSKIFINSFKKYYPDVKLCIVDNNKRNDNSFFKEETKYLCEYFFSNGEIEIFDNDTNDTSHGNGLDLYIDQIKKCYKYVVIFDIDTVFLKKGILELFQEKYNKGYRYGGWTVVGDVVHPSACYYDTSLIEKSFKPNPNKMTNFGICYDVGFDLFYDLKEKGYKYYNLPFQYLSKIGLMETKNEWIHHFGCDSIMESGGSIENTKFHPTFTTNKKVTEIYNENKQKFFETYKEYL